MRGVRFTKAEVALLHNVLTDAVLDTGHMDAVRLAASILTKLQGASVQKAPSVQVAPIEEALVRTSRGRVVALAGGGGYARASVQATNVGATVAGAELVGAWLARQGWWKQGPTTILTVLTRWPEWLAKAMATEPPPSLKEGLGAHAGSGATVAGPRAEGGRPPRGLR